jgi:hypothetical protein
MSGVQSCTQQVVARVLVIMSVTGLPGADESNTVSNASTRQVATPSLGEMTMLIQSPVAKAIGLTERQSETVMRLLRDHYTQLEGLQFRYPRGAQDGEGIRARIHITGVAANAATALQEQLRELLSDDQTRQLADVAFPKPSQVPRFEFKSTSERQRKKTRPQWGKPFGDFADGKSELRWYGSQCRLVRDEQDVGWLWHPPEFLITNVVISPRGKYVLTVGNSLPKNERVDTHSLADVRIWEASSGMLIDVIQRRDEVESVHFRADDLVGGYSYPWNGK